jgi:hypothetical protein
MTYEEFKKKFQELKIDPIYMIEDAFYFDYLCDKEESEMLMYDGEPLRDYNKFDDFIRTNFGNFSHFTNYKNQRYSDDKTVICYFEDHDLYVRFHCNYASYHGYDSDSGQMEQVRLIEKTVIFYESV